MYQKNEDIQKGTPFGRSYEAMESSEVLESIERQIQELEAQLILLKSARSTLKKLENIPQGEKTPATRFHNVRPVLAARELLEEHGEPIPKAELRQLLLNGGITIGKA
jgi:hypothetical protein